jgi:hypothetical protein
MCGKQMLSAQGNGTAETRRNGRVGEAHDDRRGISGLSERGFGFFGEAELWSVEYNVIP